MDRDKQYIVLTALHTGFDKQRKKTIVPAGQAVTLSDAEAAPLLKCKAIRLPETITVAASEPASAQQTDSTGKK